EPRAADDAAAAAWVAVDALPPLAFDHDEVIQVALASLRQRIEISDIAMGFMSERFTISDVQKAYEVIMGDQLDADVFRDWLLGQGWLEQTGDYSEPE
ncbi:MAG: NUDIX hydrolase, partial [Gammaproteobacteria bacterium]|nr:NUDIX hydrolase [Gammaproteobacteria bacterium]